MILSGTVGFHVVNLKLNYEWNFLLLLHLILYHITNKLIWFYMRIITQRNTTSKCNIIIIELTTLPCWILPTHWVLSYMFLLAVSGPFPSSLPTIEIRRYATFCYAEIVSLIQWNCNRESSEKRSWTVLMLITAVMRKGVRQWAKLFLL